MTIKEMVFSIISTTIPDSTSKIYCIRVGQILSTQSVIDNLLEYKMRVVQKGSVGRRLFTRS